MWHKWIKRTATLGLLLIIGSVIMAQAQEIPAEQTEEPPQPITLSRAEPAQMTTGVSGTVAVFGENFTSQTQVGLSNIGVLQTTFVNSETIAAAVPGSIPPGQYTIEVNDPANGSAALANALQVVAQQATETATATQAPPTPADPLTVSRTEPGQVPAGQSATLSVLGTGFTSTTTVRLVGFGFLQTTFVNSQALTAEIPASLPPGQYGIEVSDPARGVVASPNGLSVVQPTTTPAQLPTFEPPTPIPTQPPPTPIPGRPSLIVRNFSSNPAVVQPGDTVELQFEVVNQGNRAAQGIAIAVSAEGSFVPASGQATATVANIEPNGFATITLDVVAAMEAPAGPNNVPITMSYRDFSGETYSSNASISVEVGERAQEASQVVLVRYATQPDPVEPGQRIMVDLLVMNMGTENARQVLLRIAGENGLLLPGTQGDSFALGDLAPQESKNLTVPMIVSRSAEAGPQGQPITLAWLQDGERQEISGSITVDVARVIEPEPVILLQTYDTGEDILQPGDRFTLALTLQNVGSGDADNLLITFGTVEAQSSSGGSSGGSGGSTGGSGGQSGGSSGGGSTTTTGLPGNAFATIGSGSTLYAGELPAGGDLSINQEFIVNGTVDSGIYSIPITVRFTKNSGDTEQLTLPASVIVIAPPQLQIGLTGPLPEMAIVGEPLPVSLEIANIGENAVNMPTANVTAENAEIMDGAESTVGVIAAEDDATVNTVVVPSGEGTFSLTFTLHYRDDLNQMRTLEYTYQVEAVQPPPPPEDQFPPEMPPVTPEPQEDNTLGRLLLGFLGLGG